MQDICLFTRYICCDMLATYNLISLHDEKGQKFGKKHALFMSTKQEMVLAEKKLVLF